MHIVCKNNVLLLKIDLKIWVNQDDLNRKWKAFEKNQIQIIVKLIRRPRKA